MTEGVNSQGWLWNAWKICAPQRVITALLSWPWLVLGGRFCWWRIPGGQQSVMKRLSLVRAKTDDPLIFLLFPKQAENETCWNFSLLDDFTFWWSVFVQVTAEKMWAAWFFLMLALLLGVTAFIQRQLNFPQNLPNTDTCSAYKWGGLQRLQCYVLPLKK